MPELPVPTLPLSPAVAWSPQPLRAFAASLRSSGPARAALAPPPRPPLPLSLIHISEPTRPYRKSRMPSSA